MPVYRYDECSVEIADGVDELPTKPGVYVIMNRLNGRCYVGAAKNLRTRGLSHRSEMRRGYSGNMLLRRDVVKYGAENFFVFAAAVVESMQEADQQGGLVAMELRWIVQFRSYDEKRGYNCMMAGCWTPAARFRDRERKLLRRGNYVLMKGVDLYDPIDAQMLGGWSPPAPIA
jgi:hypothetical protein